MNMSTMQTAGYQNQNKLLSGGRHKKEVKRRTKTGCLTCRKRRIKVSLVDEALEIKKGMFSLSFFLGVEKRMMEGGMFFEARLLVA